MESGQDLLRQSLHKFHFCQVIRSERYKIEVFLYYTQIRIMTYIKTHAKMLAIYISGNPRKE